jgi:FAD/FMN-containing dehydrogenase/Fe-S oxidoreductase
MNYISDSLHRKLYAQDASMYEEIPLGVSFPESVEDVVQLVRQAQLDRFSITARSAGTSLAGQTTGDGVIMDVSYNMTEILEINEEEHWAEVQPGVIRDTLNREAAKHGLLFGPDTATTNRCMIGGMIGNNSSGSFSIKYKSTREHVLEMEVVLSDGSVAVFKPLDAEELEEKLLLQNLEGDIYRGMLELLEEHKEAIEEHYPHPEIIRRNTGYALDKLCEMEPITPGGRPFNLCELLCGSEGTLALTTKAKLQLKRLPKHRVLVIPHFRELDNAMQATVEAVKLKPSAVELVDHVILDATKGNHKQAQNRSFLNGEPEFILIIQFEGDNENILKKKIETLKQRLRDKKLCYAYPAVYSEEGIDRVWELRKAGLGLLMGLGKESRTPAFCEDTAVRVSDLPDYVHDFKKIMKKHEADCVYYAHASVGELHFRPMIDTTTEEGVETMKEMAEEIAELVASYRGSLSGEHGDGRARAPYIEKVLGEEMVDLLKQVKRLWDKFNVFNPGKIVFPEPIDSGLRFSPEYVSPSAETVFAWREEEDGIAGAIERCNGAGVCRKLAESGGTMCPSYMATTDEKDSTRGRANVFRQVFEGQNPEEYASRDLKEALELCLSCKACRSECPANVDMAKMKAEFETGWNDRRGIPMKNKFFAGVEELYPKASRFRFFTNGFIQSELGKLMLKWMYSISPKRNLPEFAPDPILPQKYIPKLKSPKKVTLFVDVFTRYHEPDIARDAIKVLEHCGYEVIIPEIGELGRVFISNGMLHHAKERAHELIDELIPFAERGIPIIGLEPSQLLTLRDEFLDLVDDEYLEEAKKIKQYAFLFEEFMIRMEAPDIPDASKKIMLHNHCHSKVLSGNELLQKVLRRWGFEVEEIDAGCCGMAGGFGYELDKYELSMQIGGQRLFPTIKQWGGNGIICAPGFSCRHQILDGTRKKAQHPAQILAARLSIIKK